VPVASGCQLLSTNYYFQFSGDYYQSYIYDSENKLTKTTFSSKQGNVLSYYNIYSYDAQGRIIKATTYNNADTITNYTTYAYNANNTVAADTSYARNDTGAGKLVSTGYNSYVYDNLGRVYQTEQYVNQNQNTNLPPNFTYLGYFTYVYDTKGNVLQETIFSDNIEFETATYIYDTTLNITYSAADKISNIPQTLSPNNLSSSTITQYPMDTLTITIQKITYSYTTLTSQSSTIITVKRNSLLAGRPYFTDSLAYSLTCH